MLTLKNFIISAAEIFFPKSIILILRCCAGERDMHYDTILSRTSVRRYESRVLESSLLERMDYMISQVDGLGSRNIFHCPRFKYEKQGKAASALGPFGRIFSTPYFFAPCIEGDPSALVDLGFRSQQIVLELWEQGIGSCYIGCTHQQQRVIGLLGLPGQVRIVSFIVFGVPADNQSKYLYQKISQTFANSRSRTDLDELFTSQFELKALRKSEVMMKIIEAGRRAPSATNAQPWRFEINDKYFIILAKRQGIGKIYDLDQTYALHDCGICMSNMSQAAQSLGSPIMWEPLPPEEAGRQNGLLAVARFKISQVKGTDDQHQIKI